MAIRIKNLEYILSAVLLLIVSLDLTTAGTPGYVDHGDTKGKFENVFFSDTKFRYDKC